MNNFLQLKELCQTVGLSAESIRHYEKVGLIQPIRSNNGYRQFNQATVETLKFIKNCRHVGFSIDEIKELLALQSRPQDNCERADDLLIKHIANIDEKIARLQHMKSHLTAWQNCQNQDVADCKVITGLKEL